jgi:phosphopantetheinyl transferase
MFSRILNTQYLSFEDIEKNYLNKSKNPNHYIARKLICLEVCRFLTLPYAPIVQAESGEIFLLDHDHQISISHKEENFALAITRDYESIGIDLECFDNEVDWSEFNGRFFNREDWFLAHQLSSLKNISSNQAYSILFSAKEAILKTSKLKIDSLEIKFIISNTFKNINQLQFYTNIKWEKRIYDFLTEVIWIPNVEINLPSIISVSVANKNSASFKSSLFADSKIYIQSPSILF